MKRIWVLIYVIVSVVAICMQNLFWGKTFGMYGVEICTLDSMNQVAGIFPYPFTVGLLFTYMAESLLKVNENSSWAVRCKSRKQLFGSQVLKAAFMAFCCSICTFGLILLIGGIQGMEYSNWTQKASYYYLKYERVAEPLSKALVSSYFILASTCFFLMSEMIILLFDWCNKNLIYGWILLVSLYLFDWWVINPTFSGIFYGRYNFQDDRILSVGTAMSCFLYPLMLILILFLLGRNLAAKKDFLR